MWDGLFFPVTNWLPTSPVAAAFPSFPGEPRSTYSATSLDCPPRRRRCPGCVRNWRSDSDGRGSPRSGGNSTTSIPCPKGVSAPMTHTVFCGHLKSTGVREHLCRLMTFPTASGHTYAPLIVGLYRDRGELYRRINERVRTMVEQGLVGEVEGLLARGHNPDEPAFRSIGYREFVDHGGSPPWSPEQLRRIEEDIAKNTRRYAKRQELFFRRLPDVVWIHADEIDRIVEVVRRWLAGTPIGTAERNP